MEPLLSSDGHLPGSAAAPQERPKLAKAVRKLVTGPLAQLLSSPLDPLSRCLPTVVREFSRLASRTGLLDIRGHPAVAGAGVPKQRAARPLETFFPFDPYLLRRSGAVLRLEETYVRWQKRHPRGPRGVDSEVGGCGAVRCGGRGNSSEVGGRVADVWVLVPLQGCVRTCWRRHVS